MPCTSEAALRCKGSSPCATCAASKLQRASAGDLCGAAGTPAGAAVGADVLGGVQRRGYRRGKGVLVDSGLQLMYVHAIRRAKKFLWIEQQFFDGELPQPAGPRLDNLRLVLSVSCRAWPAAGMRSAAVELQRACPGALHAACPWCRDGTCCAPTLTQPCPQRNSSCCRPGPAAAGWTSVASAASVAWLTGCVRRQRVRLGRAPGQRRQQPGAHRDRAALRARHPPQGALCRLHPHPAAP